MVAIADRCETEAVTADDNPAVKDHPITNLDIFTNCHVRINECFIANFRIVADIHEWADSRSITDLDVIANIGIGLNGNHLPDLDIIANNCGLMNPIRRFSLPPCKQLEDLDEGKVRIGDANKRFAVVGDARTNDDCRSLCPFYLTQVL